MKNLVTRSLTLSFTLLLLNHAYGEEIKPLVDAKGCIISVQNRSVEGYSFCQSWQKKINLTGNGSLAEKASASYFLSRSEYLRGDKKEALRLAEIANQLAKQTTDTLLVTRTSNYLAELLIVDGKYAEVDSVLQPVLKYYSKAHKVDSDFAHAMSLLADSQRLQHKFDQARSNYLLIKRILNHPKLNNSLFYALNDNKLAICIDKLGDKETAYPLYYQAARVAHRFSIRESTQIYQNLIAALKESNDNRVKDVEHEMLSSQTSGDKENGGDTLIKTSDQSIKLPAELLVEP